MNPLAICAEKTRFNESTIFSDRYTPIHHLFDINDVSVISCVDRQTLTRVAVSIQDLGDTTGLRTEDEYLYSATVKSGFIPYEHPNITRRIDFFVDIKINKSFAVSEIPVNAVSISDFREVNLNNDRRSITLSVILARIQMRKLLKAIELAGLVMMKPLTEHNVMVVNVGDNPKCFNLIFMRELIVNKEDVEPGYENPSITDVSVMFYGMDPFEFTARYREECKALAAKAPQNVKKVDDDVCSENAIDSVSESSDNDKDDTAIETKDKAKNMESSTTAEADDDVHSEYAVDDAPEHRTKNEDGIASVHIAVETKDDAKIDPVCSEIASEPAVDETAETPVSENSQNEDAAVETDATQDSDDDAASVHTAIEEEEEKEKASTEILNEIMSVDEYINSLPETDESIDENTKFGFKVRNLGLEYKCRFRHFGNHVLEVASATFAHFYIADRPGLNIGLIYEGPELVAVQHNLRKYYDLKSLSVNLACYLHLAKNLIDTIYDSTILLTVHFKKLEATFSLRRGGMVTLHCEPYGERTFSPKKMYEKGNSECDMFFNDQTYGSALKTFMMLPFNVNKCNVIDYDCIRVAKGISPSFPPGDIPGDFGGYPPLF